MRERATVISVLSVEWSRNDAMESRRTGGADPLGAGIRSMDVMCNVCHAHFRASRARGPGQVGFHAMIYNVVIACACGAVTSLGIDELGVGR